METARAQAELAFQLQTAKVQQRIKEEKMNIDIVDRVNQIEIQEQVRNIKQMIEKHNFTRRLSGVRGS